MSGPSTQDLEAQRAYLYRYALLHVRDKSRAEDAVQETLLAAMEGAESFGGRASLKTWLTGILKHKIIDLFRKHSREAQAPVAQEDEDEREFADHFFDQARRDHWHDAPPTWEDPERSFEQKRFWEVYERCAAQLPPQTAQVFALRELMGMTTEDICTEMGISTSNCWVILYRARMNLRECLELNWFGNGSTATTQAATR
jgi:RNA polymerase sigma-70 factor, ECF subfamily